MVVLLVALVSMPAGWVSGAEGLKTAPAPEPGGIVPPPAEGGMKALASAPGTWYVGATPPNVDKSKPPIVFVQGLHGTADSWWGDTRYYGHNDMYEIAYRNGYRTAFVELHDSSGEAADMWDNGALLAGMLEKIHRYFGERVNIVAHSKGGVDAQAALIHSGAYPHAGRVITLGPPHRGSHLADLAHSWWAGWLAELLGVRDAGTESMQTGAMEHFRSVTDSHKNVGKNGYYTAAGTDWGPFPSALWTGGACLAPYGDNDGLVNVWSTPLSYGEHLFTADFDHDQLRMGSTVFPRIQSTLKSTAITKGVSAMKEVAAAAARPEKDQPQQVVRGKDLLAGKTSEEVIHVESESEEAIFNVMTESPDVKVRLISPSGTVYNEGSPDFYRAGDEPDIFRGASVRGFRFAGPEAGEWKVRLDPEKDGAYLLTATFPGTKDLRVEVQTPGRAGEEVPVRVNLPHGWKAKPDEVKVRLVPPRTRGKKFPAQMGIFEKNLDPGGGERTSFAGRLPKLKEPGVYNLTVDLRGGNDRGEPFQRTVIRSFHVPDPKS
ncbi:lipase (class 2) [Melghirimyces profundicolus]|uniref:Lipase (Class 2) n=1 Tax=Melghirimyces profundicolus TaxID=1242148 RepID=A0A2T6B5Z5_9BACL|nr:hypothetical protein [Melghirimyces profundicolus]PTX51496.1 lipase (class 2) [Melghirimyces profundicolus]